MIRRLLSLLVVTTLFGCMPHLRPPRVTAPEAYRYADRFPQDSCTLAEQWWELFGDTTLNRLVEHALLNNRTLQASATSIAEARAQRLAARAAFLPQVDAELTAEASYERRTKITEHYGAEPVLRWEIPLFGEGKTLSAAQAHGLPLLARMPIDPSLAALADSGNIEDFTGDWLTGVVKTLL